MAKPGRKKGTLHSLEVRDRIRTTQIINRLQHFVLGTKNGKDLCIMNSEQVRGAVALLRKVLPDLQSVDATVRGDPNAPLNITTTDGRL